MSREEIKKKQTRVLTILILVLLVIVGSISFYVVHEDFAPQAQVHRSETVLPLDKSSPQELWMARLESEKSISDQRMAYLEGLVLDNTKKEAEKEKENQFLRGEIAKFKQTLQGFAEQAAAVRQQTTEMAYRNSASYQSSDPFMPAEPPIEAEPKPKRAPLTELVISDSPEKMQHVDQAIPSGTSVKAILVSSVDMPCGVFNAADPQPIKLRLIDDGHLPKNVRAKLKGGILIASAYGDLSNERIYIRLERLTQVRADGKFIETEIAGYVTGEDGKYGLKGIVVDKSYKMVKNAAISGFFSGLNDYIQAKASGGCEIYASESLPRGCDFVESGVAGGANSSFDMLTNYYIKRAEQIRPVIEAAAGRVVDVTFIHNAPLGDLHVKERVRQVRDAAREG